MANIFSTREYDQSYTSLFSPVPLYIPKNRLIRAFFYSSSHYRPFDPLILSSSHSLPIASSLSSSDLVSGCRVQDSFNTESLKRSICTAIEGHVSHIWGQHHDWRSWTQTTRGRWYIQYIRNHAEHALSLNTDMPTLLTWPMYAKMSSLSMVSRWHLILTYIIFVRIAAEIHQISSRSTRKAIWYAVIAEPSWVTVLLIQGANVSAQVLVYH